VTRWYETPAWDATAQADFEERLRRTRARPESRAEYVRMKALALEETGLLDEAVRLYERFVSDEHASWFYVPWTLERLGDIARRQGRLPEAEQYYRRLLTRGSDAASRNGTTGMTAVSLAEVLLDQGRPDEAAAALGEAEMFTVTSFSANLFRYCVASARLAQARGDSDAAADAAERALDLVDAPDQYSRHPGVGGVKSDDATVAMLRSMRTVAG
jgi:tetratricopeptide (TPR) repeat protein